MKYKLIVIGILFSFNSIFSFTQENLGLVKWLTFKQAEELNKKQAKPYMIDVYTDWCGWCKHMMKTTFSDVNLAAYINNNFYPVRFDAETSDTILFQGVKYFNVAPPGMRSTHQLAIKILNQKLSYPSIVFFADNFKFNMVSSGYMDAQKFEPILVYVNELVYKSTSVDDFRAAFTKTFYEKDTLKKPELKNYTIEKAVELSEKEKRKIVVFINTDWCISGKIMNKTGIEITEIIEKLNKNAYYVYFDPTKTEQVSFAGTNFPKLQNGFNQFAFAMVNNNLVLPSIVIFNEDKKVISVIPHYLTNQLLSKVLDFYISNSYLKMKWEEFNK